MKKNEMLLLAAALLVWLIVGDKWRQAFGLQAVKEAAIAGDPTQAQYATADAAKTPAEKAALGNRTQSQA